MSTWKIVHEMNFVQLNRDTKRSITLDAGIAVLYLWHTTGCGSRGAAERARLQTVAGHA